MNTFTKFKQAASSLGRAFVLLAVLLGVHSVSRAQLTSPTPYCKGTNSITNNKCMDTWNAGFQEIQFNTLNFSISCPHNVGDYAYYNKGSFPNFTTTVSQGATYQLHVVSMPTDYSYIMVAGYIDYNNDKDFTDPGEFLGYKQQGSTGVYGQVFDDVFNVSIPCNASAGKTRMRLRIVPSQYIVPYGSYPSASTPCTNWDYGETRDFDIEIAKSKPPKADFEIPDSVFEQAPTTFFNKNQNGYISHDWSTSMAGLGTSISNKTNLDVTFPSAGAYQVRLTSTNCLGTSTVTKNVNVITPTSAPTVRFLASRNYIPMEANDYVVDEIVDFFDFSTQGANTFQWEIYPPQADKLWFELGSLTDKNLSVLFTDTGNYEICLTAANSIGSTRLCKSNYLIIEYPQNASKYINTICKDLKSTLDSGIVYDNGGPTGNYDNITNTCEFTIEACEASEIELDVTTLALNWGDYLRIYDGDLAGTLLGSWGNNQPAATPIKLSIKSGKATLQFQTDQWDNSTGFEVKWYSKRVNDGPLRANFNVDKTRNDTIYECLSGTVVRFTDLTKGSQKITDRQWIFDYDPSISYPPGFEDFPDNGDLINPTYTYTQTKTYKVRMIATSCEGMDTVVKTFHVASTTATPSIDFTADARVLEVGESTTLRNTSVASCSGDWEISPSTYTLINGSTLSDENISVQFDAPGLYAVKYNATNDNGTASRTKTDFINVIDYCTPNVLTPVGGMSITNVEFGTINRASTLGNGGYDKSTDLSTDVYVGGTYQLKVTRDQVIDPADRKVWIDYDRDGSFSASEIVAQDNNSTTKVLSANVTIPDMNSLMVGRTRMRVGIALAGGAFDPCGPIPAGEYEDYTVNILLDDIRPTITMLGADSVYIQVGDVYNDAGATAFDNREGDITTRIVTDNQVDNTQAGIYVVTYNVKDGSGQAAPPRTRYVFVRPDMTNPTLTITGGAAVTHEVNTPYTDLGATATDNPGSVNIDNLVITNNMVDVTQLGTYDVEYMVTDAYGNTATAVRKVTVVDTKAPVITCGSQTTIQVGTPFVDNTSVTDNYWPVTLNVVAGFVNTNVFGQYKVTYSAVDGSGNAATNLTCTYTVTDLVPPVLTSQPGTQFMVVDVNNLNFVEPAVSGTDNYFPTVSITRNNGGFDISKIGTYNITYTGTDGAGNTTVWVRTIVVADREKPEVVSSPVNVMRWTAFDPRTGVSAIDNYYAPADFVNGTNGCKIEVVNSNVNMLAVGVYQVTYRAVDGSGNVSSMDKRIVNVVENTTGIGEFSLDNAVNIYPNPTSGRFDVEFGIPVSGNTTVNIVSITGQNLRSFGADAIVNGKLSVDLSDMAAGVYFVQIQSEGHVANKKVTITK